MIMIKTDKTILDFYNDIDYSFTRLDSIIYNEEKSGNNIQMVDMKLNIPKSELKDSKWITITEDLQHRPDKLAYIFYGDEKLSWIILNHNNISDPFNIDIGVVLEIPSISVVKEYVERKRRILNYNK